MLKYILHYAPAKLIPGLVNFLGLMIYARIFTQEEYGRYAYVFATLGLVQSVIFPWIRLSCSRYFQKYYKEEKDVEFENFTLFLFLLVSVLLTSLWLLIFVFFDLGEELRHLYLLGLIVMISEALLEQLMAVARAKLMSKVFAYSMILRSLLKLSTVLLLVFLFSLNEIAIFIGIIVAQVIPILIYFKKYFRFSIKYLRFNKHIFKEFSSYGLPLTFSFLLAFIISSSDRILIEYFLDTEAVGLYSIPYEFASFTLTNVFMVFSLAFFPVIVKELEHRGYNYTKERISQYFSIVLSVTLPCVIFMIMLAPYIAALFLGDNYNSSEVTLIIQLVSIATFLSGLKAYYFDFSFQLGKDTKAQIIPVIFSAISNILFNILLIPSYGVIGAVLATLLAYIIGIILSIYIGNKIFPLSISVNQLIKIVLVNAIFLICFIILPFEEINWFNFISLVISGSLIYLVLLVIFNINNIRTIILKKLSNN